MESAPPMVWLLSTKGLRDLSTRLLRFAIAAAFAGLSLTPAGAQPIADLNGALASLQQLPGSVAFLVIEGTTDRAALNADTPLSVGSTFKLSILTALRKQIDSGQRKWGDVVAMQPEWKSLPSGILQDWPDGSHLTLETLATLMISRSDNTAADALIHILGREAIEPFAFGNIPLMTTRNWFALKSTAGADLRKQFRGAGVKERRALLDQLDTLGFPQIVQADIQPADLDIGWRYSVRELCALLGGVADLPMVSINPGVVLPSDWKHIAYKGGSDAGVVNMTTLVTSFNDTTFCVSATWNDAQAAVDQNRFAALYSSILDALRNAKT